MKFSKLMIMALAGMSLVGCADLDTEPAGGTVTADQKADAVAQNPSLMSASVNAIMTNFSVYEAVSSNHYDFGYPAIMLFTDSRGIDMVGMDIGYNWFSYGFDFVDMRMTSTVNRMIWSTFYNQIYTANQVAGTIDPDTEDSQLKFYLAQALAVRAFDYFMLAQLYQFTYQGNEDAPCVPLITNENADEAAANGCARSTVGEVYAQITKDIDKAIELLSASSMKRADKRYVSLDVAYGIRARINLVKNDWAAALSDANNALANTSATPISYEEASKPGFVSMTEPNWMWGIYIAETDRVVTSGILNFPSHMGSLNYGYASVGAWRRINSSLYAQIGDGDARKGWWLDASGVSANLSEEQQDYLTDAGCPAYTQTKFAPYGDEIYTSTNACDIPLMRVEEMYLIKAEAEAMSGNPTAGAATLQAFVQAYRDPAYTCTAATAEAVQNAAWVQRRIELWGEGLSWYDLMRMRKGVDRAATAWKSMDSKMAAYNFRIADTFEAERAAISKVKSGNGGVSGEDINVLIYQIPEAETEANQLIDKSDNNLGAPTNLIPVQ